MKLLTKANEAELAKHPLYSGDGVNVAPVIVKFFYPYGAGSWYVLEAEKQEDGDYLFYGMVDLHERELGYFTLSELLTIRKFGKPAIERDMYFSRMVVNKEKQEVLSAAKAVEVGA